MTFLGMAARLAMRDMRGGLGGFWILVSGVVLGVAVMAAVGALAGGVLDGMGTNARHAVGGDISLRTFHAPPTPAQRALVESLGTVSLVAEVRAVAQSPDGARTLAEVKGVDDRYPLFGHLEATGSPDLARRTDLARRNGHWGALVDPALGLARGDVLELGAVTVEVRGLLVAEPDRAFRAFTLGPRVIVPLDALRATGLAEVGAPVYWYLRLKLPEGTAPAPILRTLAERFPDAGWRVVDASQGIPGVERTVHLARTLFVLVGLSILLIGGVGIGAAVRAVMDGKRATIATLKALGAPSRLVFAAMLGQVLAVAAGGAVLGAMIGGGLAVMGGAILAQGAPGWAPGGWAMVQPGALAAAVGAGLLAVLLFAVPPLVAACACRPVAVWRDLAPPRPGPRTLVAVLGVGGLLAGVLVAWTGMPVVTLAFVGTAAVLALGLRAVGSGVARLARRAARRVGSPRWRLVLGNLGRPGAPTVPVVLALGLGLTLLVVVVAVGASAARHVGETLPRDAPDRIVLNLAPGSAPALIDALRAVDGVERVEAAPFVHARISRLNGRPISEADVPRAVAWAVRGDRGVSWRATPAPGPVEAGAWWGADHAGPPLAAVDATVARRLGLGVGDRLSLALPHGTVEARVAVLRRMDWTALDLDFPILLSPPGEDVPHSVVVALWGSAAGGAADDVAALLADRAPLAPVVDVGAALDVLEAVAAQIRAALLGVAGLAVAAGGIVLAGTVVHGLRRRRREAAVLHALGAGRTTLGTLAGLEFGLLGAVVAGLALPLGLGGAAAVVAAATGGPLVVPPLLPALVVAGAVAVPATLALILGRRPPPLRVLVRDGESL